MLLETEKENVCINKKVGQKKEEFTVEGDIIVSDIKPDVLSVISTTGIPCIYKKEVSDGKVRIDGSINTYIIYLADSDDSTVRSLNTVIDFTDMIDIENCRSCMVANEKVSIKKIETRILNGRKLNVKVILEVEVEVYSNENIQIVSNINNLEDIQVLNNQKIVNFLIGDGNTKVYAKDTISIDDIDDLAEIMKASIKIIDRDMKLSYNKVLAKAELEISIMYLTEDNRIKNISSKIPIMGFIDIEKISDNNICDIDYKIKNFIIKPNNAESNSIYVEAEIEIICFAYETRKINLIEDLYSISTDLKFTQNEIITMQDKANIKDICNINEQITISEIGNKELYNVQIIPRIQNVIVRNGKIIYEGRLDLEVLFGTNNGMDSRNILIPFDFQINCDNVTENSNIDTIIDIKREDFIASGEKINTNIELEFNVSISKNETINIIDEISIEESSQNNIYSMVIYFVKPGDSLWSISKRFKSTIDDILRVNNIEDENKISIGQQLYIPKFVNKSIAV